MTDTSPQSLAADDDVRVTEPFVTRSGDYLNVIMRWWLRRYGWMLWLPIVGVAVVGAVLRDERIAIVALLLVFIIMPMVMLFIYIYYILTPQARRVVLRKRVLVADGRYIRLEYLPEPREEDKEECESQTNMAVDVKKTTDGEQSTDKVVFPLPADETIPWDEVRELTWTARYMVYVLNCKPRQLILVPHSAFRH